MPPSAPEDPSQNGLYLEAEQVYRGYFEEMRKVEASGYASPEWPASMDGYVTGRMKEVLAKSIADTNADTWRTAPGQTTQLVAVAPNPGEQLRGSIISIRVCTDARYVAIVDKETGELGGYGPLLYKQIYFKRFAGKLKGFTQASSEVETCPIS